MREQCLTCNGGWWRTYFVSDFSGDPLGIERRHYRPDGTWTHSC